MSRLASTSAYLLRANVPRLNIFKGSQTPSGVRLEHLPAMASTRWQPSSWQAEGQAAKSAKAHQLQALLCSAGRIQPDDFRV